MASAVKAASIAAVAALSAFLAAARALAAAPPLWVLQRKRGLEGERKKATLQHTGKDREGENLLVLPMEEALNLDDVEKDRPHLYETEIRTRLLSGQDPSYAYGNTPIVINAVPGLPPPLPHDPMVHDSTHYPPHGREKVYLHVYGLFKTCYVVLRDQEAVSGFALPNTLMKTLKTLNLKGKEIDV
ncbi:hypothetical protein CAPTEDRAFT_195005 [Capitella teleta]|uniref:Uncharacterized protein n=1 Tax=Capitella teleta TaxID=283909 RepID=R7UFH7_CAPTE|nr:hypothetical protein CAPTEDRAFT_195005 [Capitella teleta]|eukprot:ELU02017.1 hypothetical protein CAPTEDRAFT_195005 [Capitella teleta]